MMSYEDFFYWSGAIFWCFAGTAIGLIIAWILWVYLSIGLSSWWVRLAAAKHYPEGKILKKEFTNQSFWRTRLLFVIMKDVGSIMSSDGTKLNGIFWVTDYTGFFPKAWVVTFSENNAEDDAEDVEEI